MQGMFKFGAMNKRPQELWDNPDTRIRTNPRLPTPGRFRGRSAQHRPRLGRLERSQELRACSPTDCEPRLLSQSPRLRRPHRYASSSLPEQARASARVARYSPLSPSKGKRSRGWRSIATARSGRPCEIKSLLRMSIASHSAKMSAEFMASRSIDPRTRAHRAGKCRSPSSLIAVTRLA